MLDVLEVGLVVDGVVEEEPLVERYLVLLRWCGDVEFHRCGGLWLLAWCGG